MAIAKLSEVEFKKALRLHLTPARPISSIEYLRGRQAKLTTIERAFNSAGKHVFIHGDRGVGKTSLARTAAIQHNSSGRSVTDVLCEPGTQPYALLRDIIVRVMPPAGLQDGMTATIKAGFPFLSAEVVKKFRAGGVPEVHSMNDALTFAALVGSTYRDEPAVIVDEIDVIGSHDTRKAFASFVKHISDQEIPLRLIMCGIGDSLDEMIGSHQSAGRYFMPIQLERLPHDARWEIIDYAAQAIGVRVDKETLIRIGQISDGYPYFVHLLGEKLFWAMYDDTDNVSISTPLHFETALREASAEAAPSLKRGYEKATQKYTTGEYDHALWAVADSSALRRQVKDIYASYERIVGLLKLKPLELKTFYSRMNSLKTERHGGIIRTTGAGWFEFRENQVRGYVRLIAEQAGVQLEPEHHFGKKLGQKVV